MTKDDAGTSGLLGTQIPVQAVLELLDEGLSCQEIIQDYYPGLRIEDIHACVEMAHDKTGQDNLEICIAKRKACDPQFSTGFEKGFAPFKLQVQQQVASDRLSKDSWKKIT